MQRVELTEWESCKKVDDEGSRGEEGGSHRRGREGGEPRGSNGQRRLSCRCNPPVSVSEMNWRWSESGFTETTVQHVSQRRKKKQLNIWIFCSKITSIPVSQWYGDTILDEFLSQINAIFGRQFAEYVEKVTNMRCMSAPVLRKHKVD